MGLGRGAEDWRVTLAAAGGALELTLRELHWYPHVQTEMVLQCSGNSRGRFGGVSPVSGSRWQDGAVANVVFGGARLRDVLADAAPDLLRGARYLTPRGAGTPHEDDLPPLNAVCP